MTQRMNLEDIKALKEDPNRRIWIRPPHPKDFMVSIKYHDWSYSYDLVRWSDLQVQHLEWMVKGEYELIATWGFTIQ